jgi:DNA-directed RNA polymerase specialized sigma24 family protein
MSVRVDLDSHVEAKRALSVLASLPARQRRYLTLLVADYRHQEIARLTGATYTKVLLRRRQMR